MKAIPQTASILIDLQFPLLTFEFLTIALSILETLSKVHAKGLSQGSIYPGNIWYDPTSKLSYILDFSYCGRESENVSNFPYSMLPYIAPERTNQNESQLLPSCQSSDLYAMGVIFFEMVTGRLPFDFADHLQIIHAHVAVKPYRADAILNRVPPIIASIIDKLLSKDPEERYITSHGLSRDIAHCMSYVMVDSEFHRSVSKKKLGRQMGEIFNVEIPQFQLGLEDITDDFQLSDILYQREVQLGILKNCLTRVEKHGDVQLAIIHGDEGTGKTSLLSKILTGLSHDTWFCLTFSFEQTRKAADTPEYLLSIFGKQGGIEVPKIGHQILSRSKQEVDHWRELLRSTLYNEGTILLDYIPSLKELIGQLPPSNIAEGGSSKRLLSVVCKFIKVLAGSGHPLVLAIDNMQWVDPQMLQLFLALTSLQGLSHVLFILLYRDGEVDKKHPLIKGIKKCERNCLAISDIHLANLDQENVLNFISDSLRLFNQSDIDLVVPLAELVYKKTRGNPFFVCKFLRTIYNDGLLSFDSAKHKWIWDLERIQQSQYTENVISCLTQTIVTLPATQQHILKQAACVGSEFDVFSLTQLLNHQTPTKFEESYVLEQLFQIAEEDLLSIHMDGKKQIFCFPHEQIQNAAYLSLSEEERKKSHLKIGILWLKEFLHLYSNDRNDPNLCPPYRVLHHLNLGRDLIKDRNFQVDLARYNLLTAKASEDLSGPSDVQCLNKGIDLLLKDNQAWKEHHELLFELHLLLYIRSNEKLKDENLFQELILHSKTKLEKINTFTARVDKLISRNQLKEAILCVSESMKQLFDINITMNSTMDQVIELHKQVHEHLKGREIMSLEESPGKLYIPEGANLKSEAVITLLERIGVQKLISKCIGPAYFISPIISLQFSFLLIILSIKWGFSEYTLVALTFYTMGCIHSFRNLEEGLQFSKLLLSLGTNHFPTQKHFAIQLYIDRIQIWENKSIKAGFHDPNSQEKELWESFRTCLKNGEINYALLILLFMSNLIIEVGDPLEICKEKITRYYVFMRRIVRDYIDLLIEGHLRNISLLMDINFAISNIIPDEEFEDIKIPLYDNIGEIGDALTPRIDNQSLIAIKVWYYIQQIQYYYTIGNYVDADVYLKKAELNHLAIYGSIDVFNLLFYGVLVRCKLIDNLNNIHILDASSPKLITNIKSEIVEILDQISFWDENSNVNFGNRVAIAEAEFKRVNTKLEDSCDLYRKAIQLSKIGQFIHHEALAHELFGECLLQMGKKASCRTELLEALRCYKSWGATAKEKQLEEHYRQIWQFAPISNKGAVSSSNPSNFSYDSQLIADTTNILQNGVSIGGVLKTTMQHIFRYSGAQNGCLIIENQTSLMIEVESKGVDEFLVLHSEALSGQKYCMGVINYVNTIRNIVLLANAAQDSTFLRDPYIQQNQTRSILCIPILAYTQLIAILYLENSSVTGVFSKLNIPLLSTIAMQMVQSVKIARLSDRVQKIVPTFNHSSEDKDILKEGVLFKKVDKLLGHGWEYSYAVLSYEGLILYQSKKLNKINDKISIYSIQKVSQLNASSSSFFIRPPYQFFLRITLNTASTNNRVYFSVPTGQELKDWEREISSLLPSSQMSSRYNSLSNYSGSGTNSVRNFESNIQIRDEEITFGRALGRGAFSTVYLCTWNGVKIAVKVFEGKIDEEEETDFFKELSILKTLRHPNILLFLGAFSGHMGNCILTEYMAEGSLFDLLKDKSKYLSDAQKIQLAKDIANGMLYLHSFNPPIIHRDLKSPNVLVDESGTAKVADFGVARFKAQDDKTMTTKQGTVAWMAPEVFEGQTYTELADGLFFIFKL